MTEVRRRARLNKSNFRVIQVSGRESHPMINELLAVRGVFIWLTNPFAVCNTDFASYHPDALNTCGRSLTQEIRTC